MDRDELLNEINDFLENNGGRLMKAQWHSSLKWELINELVDKIIKLHEKGCEYN